MMIGAISAIIILFIYSIVVKCCTRRTREQLSSFAQDRPANRNGDNQYLLGQDSKRVRRFPSNSDEDI
ncbi:unnamed protein product [Caenorhabditis angaria]|uniref:Uncharacterized protein n=1 Tax=Caenorhabditis angaria TaxID=860376 RepID=A0A9P1I4I1_9PELO|nr:unnamed protein product [Caenorhabditis angaria]